MDILNIPQEMIKRGLENAYWPGRFEVVGTSPVFILDGAHNQDAAKKLSETLQNYFTNRKITYIIGVLADKEHKKMLEIMLPLAKRVYTVTPRNKRALAGEALVAEVESLGYKAQNCAEAEDAVREAFLSVAEDEVIVAFGSLSYLAEVKEAAERLRYNCG
jgi:dihydrofolate synthase/folylpolyglutamate synthase